MLMTNDACQREDGKVECIDTHSLTRRLDFVCLFILLLGLVSQ